MSRDLNGVSIKPHEDLGKELPRQRLSQTAKRRYSRNRVNEGESEGEVG